MSVKNKQMTEKIWDVEVKDVRGKKEEEWSLIKRKKSQRYEKNKNEQKKDKKGRSEWRIWKNIKVKKEKR